MLPEAEHRTRHQAGPTTVIDIEVVVAGAVGDLARSMLQQLSGYEQSTRVVVCSRRALGDLLAGLDEARLDVERVTALTVSPEEPPARGEAQTTNSLKHENGEPSRRVLDKSMPDNSGGSNHGQGQEGEDVEVQAG